MPHLLTLGGRPLSWAALHAANEAWHAKHGQYGYTEWETVCKRPTTYTARLRPGSALHQEWTLF